jgi:hypothetical protein
MQFCSTDETVNPGAATDAVPNGIMLSLTCSVAGRVYDIIANPYQFFVYLFNATDEGTWIMGTVPCLPPSADPLSVAEVVVQEGGLIQIETSVAHGKVTGQQVYVGGISGVSGANGVFTVTVLSDTVFTLDGSNGSGAYVAETGQVGDTNRISAAWLLYQGQKPVLNVSV